jgi:hypothetical protein
MRNVPPEVMATWPQPNYDDPVRRGNALIITELSIVSVAILTLVARLYVRFRIVRTSGADDWVMLVAMVSRPMHISIYFLASVNVYRRPKPGRPVVFVLPQLTYFVSAFECRYLVLA